MKKILEKILYILAKAIIWRYQPTIIGITGSVGKTSTKEAIFAVLKDKFDVRKNEKNYNNEIGVPLTIIGTDSGNKNIFIWLFIFIKAILMLVYFPYPKILILEMGADKPGDIKYLTRLAPCHIGILTAIGDSPVHLEFFKNIEHLIREKTNIISHLKVQDFAIINLDDEQLQSLPDKTKAQIITVGQDEKAQLRASDINYSLNLEEAIKNNNAGINFKIHYEGHTIPFKINNALGLPQVYAGLFAIACGLVFKMNLVEISKAIGLYRPLAGRMNLLFGIKDTYLIDDTYNSSPLACKKGLDVLGNVQTQGRKIACLGNMEELGENSRKAHRQIGRLIVEKNIDILFAVGDKAKDIAAAAEEKGMKKDNIFTFNNSQEASAAVLNEIHHGDVILIKGSQSARMERITKTIMAEPLKAEELLVRQSKSWQNK